MKEEDLSLVINALNDNKHRLHKGAKLYSLNKKKQFVLLNSDEDFLTKDLYFENHAFTLCNILKIIYPSISVLNLTMLISYLKTDTGDDWGCSLVDITKLMR